MRTSSIRTAPNYKNNIRTMRRAEILQRIIRTYSLVVKHYSFLIQLQGNEGERCAHCMHAETETETIVRNKVPIDAFNNFNDCSVMSSFDIIALVSYLHTQFPQCNSQN